MEDNREELQEQEMEAREEQDSAAISRLAYLSNTSAYEYTPEQVEQMFSALEQELAQVKAQFQKTEKTKKTFSFQ